MASIDVHTLNDLLSSQSDTTVVDVREHGEYLSARVPGSRLIPLSQLLSRHAELGQLPGPVYVICASGGRSIEATGWLAQQGYPVVNVDGGVNTWVRAGLPVERG